VPGELEKAIIYFEKAIEQDPKFARAYAAVAITYYYLDESREEKKYGEQINYYADKALLFDDKLPQSLIAKALFYMHNKEYELAVSYFEKALEYNPNNDLVFVFLLDLYVNRLPNTAKYLEYALKGIDIDVASYDSITASFNYLHIGNAFIQSGFVKEAQQYIDKSLEYYPENFYSAYVRAFIMYAKNQDLERLNRQLIRVYQKDSSNLEVMQDVGKIYYLRRNYDFAYLYYKKFNEMREALKLDICRGENAKIAMVYSQTGFEQEASKLLDDYLDYANNDQTIYRYLSLAAYYSVKDEKETALENLGLFSQQENYFYWILLFTDIDPLMDNVKDLKEFKDITEDIRTKFRDYHKSIRASLEKEGLI
jgi:tetratricopeptide (TPR) repeat protein